MSPWFQITQLYPTGSHTSWGLPPSTRTKTLVGPETSEAAAVAAVEHRQA